MRIAIDTNVLVRYLTADDVEQHRLAAERIHQADQVFLSMIVLCETVWVLSRAYGYKRAQITDILSALMNSHKIQTNRPALSAGIAMMHRGGDFADGVIHFDATGALALPLLTFDRRLAQRANGPGIEVLAGEG